MAKESLLDLVDGWWIGIAHDSITAIIYTGFFHSRHFVERNMSA